MNPPTGLRATLSRLRAVASLTFLEAVRRKVFLIVLIVGGAIVSSAAFLPAVDAAGRLRLVEIWSIRTVTIFCSLGAIFLAGFSLPGDFEQRRIYTLVTKPIHKGTLFLGKFLGFLLLMAVFLALMGAITLVYLRIIGAVSKDFPEARVHPKHLPVSIEGPIPSQTTGGKAVGSHQAGKFVEYRFEGLPAGRFPDRVEGRAKLDLRRLPNLEFRLEARVQVTAVHPETREEHPTFLDFNTNSWTPFDVSNRAVSEDGRLLIRIFPAEPDVLIGGMPDELWIRSNPVSFELNFMKGMLLVLLQSALVLLATLAASTVVSAPVSLLIGISLFLTGSTWSFVTESLEDVDRRLQEVEKREAGDGHDHAPDDLPPWMLRVSGALSRSVLQLVPNFDEYNFGDWLLSDTAVSGRDLGNAFLSFFPRAAILLVAGLLLISFRDFAT